MGEKSSLTMNSFYIETGDPRVLGGVLRVDNEVYTDEHTRFDDAKKPPDEFNWSANPGEAYEF